MIENPEEYTLIELATLMAQKKYELDEVTAEKTALQKEYDELRIQIIPERMEEQGVQNITLKGVGRLSCTGDLRVSVLAANRVDLHDWMRGNDHAELVTNTINSSTLKAWVKEQIREGEEYPIDLIAISPFMRASITKA